MTDRVERERFEPHVLGRRGFLVAAGGAGVAVAFAPSGEAIAAMASSARDFQPNAWVVIAADGAITIMSAACEMGQGVMTTLPMLVAEDLDADWRRVRVVQSSDDAKAYGNPALGGVLSTIASRTVLGYYERLRLAGAQARQLLLATAANRWQLPVAELSTEPGFVVHAGSGKRVGYGPLASLARVPDVLPVIRPEDLKPIAQCRYIGRGVPRVDVPAKVDGTAVFGIDVRRPGMLYAAVLHPPVQGERPERVDDRAALGVAGVVKVVRLPHGVGVIAKTVEASRAAKLALEVEWSASAPARGYSSRAVAAEYLAIARDRQKRGLAMVDVGDTDAAMRGAAKVISADFLAAHVAHACLEPMSATALVTDDRVEVWASNQSPTYMKQFCAAAAGVTPDKVKINSTYAGGGFGRRTDGDEEVEAVQLARAVPGRPVKVIWSREDDIANDKFRPLTAQHIEVGLDAGGQILAWRHRIVNESVLARADSALLARYGGKDLSSAGGGEFGYGVPTHFVEWVRAPRGVGVGAWRNTSPGFCKFAIETVIDEIAHGKGQDPVAFRLELLGENARATAVVKAAAGMADWTRPRPPGRAIGFGYSDAVARTAAVAEVSLDTATGVIRVHQLWAASDPGVALDPRNCAAQLEGAMVMGLSAALSEDIQLENGVVQQSNFHDYKPIRMAQVPPIEVTILSTDNKPGGIGEAGVPPVAPAIANAVARLTGKRLRQLPMSPENVLAVLAA